MKKKKRFIGWENDYYTSDEDCLSDDSSESEEEAKHENVRTVSDAIVKVFESMRKGKILSLQQICKEIIKCEFYRFNTKTPAYSVGNALHTDISENHEKSRFIKASRGKYKLRQ